MTNGEIIQRDFPNEFLSLIPLFTREWWNAEYKESTTKDNCGVIENGITIDEATENVNHPKHYNITGRKECIVEMLENFGVDAVITFCTLNAYKYRYRHELKNGQEDLEKAKWYENYALKLRK